MGVWTFDAFHSDVFHDVAIQYSRASSQCVSVSNFRELLLAGGKRTHKQRNSPDAPKRGCDNDNLHYGAENRERSFRLRGR